MASEHVADGLALDEVPYLRHPWTRPRPPLAPGRIGRASALFVQLALAASVLLIGYTLEVVRVYADGAGDAAGVAERLAWQSPLAALVLLAAWAARRERDLGLALRLCALIPAVHIGWLVFAQGVWLDASAGLWVRWRMGLGVQTPTWQIVVAVGACLLLLVRARRLWRGRDPTSWLRPLYTASLSFVALLGLWLPLMATYYADVIYWRLSWVAEPRLAVFALVPPAVGAVIVALSPAWARGRRLWGHLGVRIVGGVMCGIVVLTGVLARADADELALLVYANFIPALACAASVALLCIAALGACHWRALRGGAHWGAVRDAQPLVGEVVAVGATPEVGRLRYLGWLRGFRMETAAFVLRTKRGNVPLPSGARLVAPLPSWTTTARAGDTVTVLRAGDTVSVSGLVESVSDGAYRGSAAPIAGARGVVVMTDECATSSAWRELILATWRPVVLYVIVTALVLLPGLAGVLAL